MSPTAAHRICAIANVEVLRPYVIRVRFDDASEQTIDLELVLEGELYGPLRDIELVHAATLDPVARTLVWPNGADSDSATLHDWPRYADAFAARAREWRAVAGRN
jgi:hypothetical protein